MEGYQKKISRIICLPILFLFSVHSSTGIEIERFEHLTTRDGLSQNSVLSIYCDHLGFMWFGTMNGLNRYDGYDFKIYRSEPGRDNVLSHNRIISIWEDPQLYLWVQTNDGYYHYLNRETDQFHTYPKYLESEEEKNSVITCLDQNSKDELWLGTDRAGVYFLKYDSIAKKYRDRHFISRGVGNITNNQVSFIFSDQSDHVWIGTRNGLNLLSENELNDEEVYFQHLFVDQHFLCYTFQGDKIWMGTGNKGIIIYDSENEQFDAAPEFLKDLQTTKITTLHTGKFGHVVIGTESRGLFLYYPVDGTLKKYAIQGNYVKKVYEDYFGNIWVNTEHFGVSRIDPVTGDMKYFVLTPREIQPLVDDERQYFYEDSDHALWIGLHGAGLAHYDQDKDEFEFFRNNPRDLKTISSNFVHCIAEDKSGLLWIGTGQFNGGINKVIPANSSFRCIIPESNIIDRSMNVVRAVFEDSNHHTWLATKSGMIYIYDSDFNLVETLDELSLVQRDVPGYNVYTIKQDRDGFIWLGSKGGGVAVSTISLLNPHFDYSTMDFFLYNKQPEQPTSLSSDMVYSILQDKHNRIWIGTYGGGLNLVEERWPDRMVCRHINRSNSNLSSDDIRQVFEDTKGQIWIASNFGLNLMQENALSDSLLFRVFYYDPMDVSSISYNDVIHLFEDSHKRLWIGTFGGGVNLLERMDPSKSVFKHYNQTQGLSNDAVFGILEDDDGYIWFSTENGISRFNSSNEKFENFNEHDGLISCNFNENTCFKTSEGQMIFGTTNGALLIFPDRITYEKFIPPVVLTKFQLFNKDVDIDAKDSPLHSTIETTKSIMLKHWQSSFSIEYTALNYFDPVKNRYSFILENFEETWNDINNQRKATYTNLPPGEYIFKVKAADSFGEWDNSSIQELTITIQPPWWGTNLAYLIYLIVFMVLAESSRRILSKYRRLRNDLQVEKKVNEIKLKFFTNISHEIRTPLTLILGPLEDIRTKKELPGALKRSVDVMYRNGTRMLRLINQLLDFRKIQYKKMKLKVRKVRLPEFVATICNNFEYLAEQKNIDFSFQVKCDTSHVWIDAEKIDTILFNILSNAFKFTPHGKSIEVIMQQAEEPDFVNIIIRDEGPGIPKEKIELLFTRFTNLSAGDKYLTGSGIGLSLSKELIEMHHGEILVNSIMGKGSEFIIRLPVGNEHFSDNEVEYLQSEPVEQNQLLIEEWIEEECGDPPQRAVSAHSPTVLIVEDNSEVRNYISDVLSSYYNVVSASDGNEGLKITDAIHPDIIIADIMMPEMDGLQMIRMIKNDFDICHIPVIMLTSRSALNDQVEGIEAGAEAYILKPFSSRYLLSVIKNLIDQRKKIFEKYSNKALFSPGEVAITDRDQRFLQQIMDQVEKNYSDSSFNVERLAALSGVGRTVFYNKIKGLTGFTPVEFLRNMRLNIAGQFLRKTDYSISEIAYMTGFNDVKYFQRCFKSLFKMNPSDFRGILKSK